MKIFSNVPVYELQEDAVIVEAEDALTVRFMVIELSHPWKFGITSTYTPLEVYFVPLGAIKVSQDTSEIVELLDVLIFTVFVVSSVHPKGFATV